MSKEHTTSTGMAVTVDPLDAYEGIKPAKLLEATGLLRYFAAEVALTEPESVKGAFDDLMECYGMGLGQDGSGWGTVEDMVYKSTPDANGDPLDPDMSPLVAFHLTGEIDFLVYQYSICAVTDGKETLMMRID
jgi:hypothetical protein